eukprot:2956268-Rhodomonas_salina.1
MGKRGRTLEDPEADSAAELAALLLPSPLHPRTPLGPAHSFPLPLPPPPHRRGPLAPGCCDLLSVCVHVCTPGQRSKRMLVKGHKQAQDRGRRREGGS